MTLALLGSPAQSYYTSVGYGPDVICPQQVNGSSMIVLGVVFALTAGALTTSSGVTSVTDNTGAPWEFSPANSQFPPSVYSSAFGGLVTFVAWRVNAAQVTSVTLQTAQSGNDWCIVVLETAGVLVANAGTTAAGTGTACTGRVPLANAGDLTVAAAAIGTTEFFTTTPPGMVSVYSDDGMSFCYDVTGASGGTAAWTMTSQQYALAAASFSAAPTYPAVPPPPVMQIT
jgi:hypothetical protein